MIFCLVAGTAFAQSEPTGKASSEPVTTLPIHYFQKYLSRVDGDRCPMTPSCSRYALQATQRHGAFWGWIMACDRLMRCGHDELKHSPPVRTRNGIRYRDPVENNDFWWH
jgi:uncharacterized protein